ncbi:lipocalin family protein [Thaumasiovibrio subtropicus]|uniref:lipocalin family protein n=1 Tax=Thaumasiovibrio subtropicus TaxID=1891207 RepID=UPI000B35633A|nr:lipocalin family protein [Thaumasiovibrio subtropicus]
MKHLWKGLTLFFSALVMTGCLGKPENVEPVQDFELDRYLGKWYEIARLDHSFERGLDGVTAEYSMRGDGGVKVVNRGIDIETGQLDEAVGKAYFVNSADEAFLKVSFFGPFYGSYIVWDLEENYQYAFVSGPDLDYLWLLSRTPDIAPEVVVDFQRKAEAIGFDVSQLIYVNH